MTINPDDTLYAITEAWPATIPAFVNRGFPQMADETKRAAFGKQITLRQALSMKQIDLDAFLEHLDTAVRQADGSLSRGNGGTQASSPTPFATVGDAAPASSCAPSACAPSAGCGPVAAAAAERAGTSAGEIAPGDIRISGLLPCPVRIPLLESFETFVEAFERDSGKHVHYELQAASMGAAWMEENLGDIQSADELPDLFISAGFETFFDPNGIGRFRDDFVDAVRYEEFNASFDGIELRDPGRHYSMISVVPAVFMVNRNELGAEPAPESWEDVLDERFAGRVSLPVGDFDLFSSILLGIHQRYGDDGVRRLGRSLSEAMHPAQMVKNAKRTKTQPPIVTIMPYFFTRMATPDSPMMPVWPSDGAILSPIFMLAKKSRREELQPLVDFFASKELGEILAHKGLFPSTHPEVDNQLDPAWTFNWLGWDYVKTKDVRELIARCQALFEEGKPS